MQTNRHADIFQQFLTWLYHLADRRRLRIITIICLVILSAVFFSGIHRWKVPGTGELLYIRYGWYWIIAILCLPALLLALSHGLRVIVKSDKYWIIKLVLIFIVSLYFTWFYFLNLSPDEFYSTNLIRFPDAKFFKAVGMIAVIFWILYDDLKNDDEK